MRLIDADKLDINHIGCYYGSNCYLDDVEDWIKNAPTIIIDDMREFEKTIFKNIYDSGDLMICISENRKLLRLSYFKDGHFIDEIFISINNNLNKMKG